MSKEENVVLTGKNAERTKGDTFDLDPSVFDITFQRAVLKLVLTDDNFCSNVIKYFVNDEALKIYDPFANQNIHTIFNLVVEFYSKYGQKPSKEIIVQQVQEFEKEKVIILKKELKKIYQSDVSNIEFYSLYLTHYIKMIKFNYGYRKAGAMWKKKPFEAITLAGEVIEDLKSISFSEDRLLTLDDLGEILQQKFYEGQHLQTGIKELDDTLLGGIPRGGLTLALGGTNVGKSIWCLSVCANVLRATDRSGNPHDNKVLYVNLEGKKDQALKRIAANLSEVEYEKIAKNRLDQGQYEKIREIMSKYKGRLAFKNLLDFNDTVESFVAWLREYMRANPETQLIVVDYAELFKSDQRFHNKVEELAYIYRTLAKVAANFNVALITPVQSTRSGQSNEKAFNKASRGDKPILRSTDVANCYDAARVAEVIISLNATDEEKKNSEMRIFLEKQREGETNKLFGVYTEFSKMNLITGRTFDPYSAVKELDVEEEKEQNISVDDLDKKPLNKEEKKKALEQAVKNYRIAKEEMIKVNKDLKEEETKKKPDMKEIVKLKDDKENFRKDKEESKLLVRKIAKDVYPDIKEEELEVVKSSLKDMKKDNLPTDKIKEQEMYLNILELYFKGSF